MCLKAEGTKEWLLSDTFSKIMRASQELQQTRTRILESPEGLFENQINRMVVGLIDISNEFILSYFNFLSSIDADYIHYVACLIFYPCYPMLTGLKLFTETNGTGKFSVIVKWYTQKLIKLVESCARYKRGSSVHNTSILYGNSFGIFGSTINARGKKIISVGVEIFLVPET